MEVERAREEKQREEEVTVARRRRIGTKLLLLAAIAVCGAAVADRLGFVHVPVEKAAPWAQAALTFVEPGVRWSRAFVGLDTPVMPAPAAPDATPSATMPEREDYAPIKQHPLLPYSPPEGE